MQRRHILGAFALTAVIAILAAAWSHLYRPSPLSAVLGIGDVAPRRRSICRPVGWLTRLGPVPQGREFCDWFSPDTMPRQSEHQELEFSLTRRVVYAQRSWGPRDGPTWRRQLDSVRTVLQAQGGVRRPCRNTILVGGHAIEGGNEHWVFPGYVVDLFAVHDHPLVGTEKEIWFIDLTARARFAQRCG